MRIIKKLGLLLAIALPFFASVTPLSADTIVPKIPKMEISAVNKQAFKKLFDISLKRRDVLPVIQLVSTGQQDAFEVVVTKGTEESASGTLYVLESLDQSMPQSFLTEGVEELLVEEVVGEMHGNNGVSFVLGRVITTVLDTPQGKKTTKVMLFVDFDKRPEKLREHAQERKWRVPKALSSAIQLPRNGLSFAVGGEFPSCQQCNITFENRLAACTITAAACVGAASTTYYTASRTCALNAPCQLAALAIYTAAMAYCHFSELDCYNSAVIQRDSCLVFCDDGAGGDPA